MTSKSQRKSRRRSRSISLAGGDSATAPPMQGSREPQEDPRKVAIEARARVLGVNAEDAASGMMETQAGCCIHASIGDKAALWQAWQDLSAARRNYRMRIIGTTGDPKCAAIAMIPDAMQTDTGLTVDIRTAEERDNAARNAWGAWSKRINGLPLMHMAIVLAALDDRANLWQGGVPTGHGMAFVSALRMLTN